MQTKNLLALTALNAAVAGTIQPRTLVLSVGTTTIPTTGTTILASGWCAPKLCEY